MRKDINIYIGGDHAGYKIKGLIKEKLDRLGLKCTDFGPKEFVPTDDYPDFLHDLAYNMSRSILDGKNVIALIFSGSGMGESIVLNRYTGIRCGVFYSNSESVVKNFVEHDNINALSLGCRFVSYEEIWKAINTFLNTEFSNSERFVRRIKKIDSMNKNND